MALFSEEVIFRSPAVYKAYHGRAHLREILGAVSRVLEDFRYARQIGAAGAADHALVVQARVGRAVAEAMRRELGLDGTGKLAAAPPL